MHKNRAHHPGLYGYATTNQADPVPEHYRKPWFQQRECQQQCELCFPQCFGFSNTTFQLCNDAFASKPLETRPNWEVHFVSLQGKMF